MCTGLVQPLGETLWRFLKKLKIELPYDPAILLLGIQPEENVIYKGTCTPTSPAALLTTADTERQQNLHQRLKLKQNVLHICEGLLAIKTKTEVRKLCHW